MQFGLGSYSALHYSRGSEAVPYFLRLGHLSGPEL